MSLESLSKPENAAAVWSAVAATFSAVAAAMSWQAQMKTLRHSFRPELVLSGWQRAQPQDGSQEFLAFSSIRNTGRDTARQITINAFALADDKRPTYFMGTLNIASLTPGEQVQVGGRIIVNWKNVPNHPSGGKYLHLEISVWCWDALGVRHVTKLFLMLLDDPSSPVGGAAQLAPGVHLSYQTTTSVPVWKLRFRSSLRKIPLLGKLVPSDA